jgi:uncharacterized protein YgiM (DUF1202 family)
MGNERDIAENKALEEAAKAEAEATAAAKAGQSVSRVVVDVPLLNIRSKAHPQSTIAGTLKKGVEVAVKGESGAYYEIDSGFIRREFTRPVE